MERKRRETPPRPKILDGEAEAKVIALRLSDPPAGYANWSLRLLAEKIVELEIVDRLRDGAKDTKKNGFSCKGKVQYWVIPPEAEFVARMEQVLDTYAKRYDPRCRLHGRTTRAADQGNAPAATKDHPQRVDYERAGTASIFMFCEALWRQATARKRRTKVDWAEEVASLLEDRYADCEKITLVCDNTHTPGAFYEASCTGKRAGPANRVLLHATGAG